jgi:hypothetical protein
MSIRDVINIVQVCRTEDNIGIERIFLTIRLPENGSITCYWEPDDTSVKYLTDLVHGECQDGKYQVFANIEILLYVNGYECKTFSYATFLEIKGNMLHFSNNNNQYSCVSFDATLFKDDLHRELSIS